MNELHSYPSNLHGFAVLMNPAAPRIEPVTLLDLNTHNWRGEGWWGPINWHFATRRGMVSMHLFVPMTEADELLVSDPDGMLWDFMWALACELVDASPEPYRLWE